MSFRPVKLRAYGTAKEAVCRLVADAGGVKRAAHLIQRSATQVYAYSDPDVDDEISFDDVLRLTGASRSAAPAGILAAAAGGFVTMVEDGEASLAELLGRGEREHGSAMALIFERIGWHASGQLPEDHRAELERDLDLMIRAFVAARRRLAGGLFSGAAATGLLMAAAEGEGA